MAHRVFRDAIADTINEFGSRRVLRREMDGWDGRYLWENDNPTVYIEKDEEMELFGEANPSAKPYFLRHIFLYQKHRSEERFKTFVHSPSAEYVIKEGSYLLFTPMYVLRESRKEENNRTYYDEHRGLRRRGFQEDIFEIKIDFIPGTDLDYLKAEMARILPARTEESGILARYGFGVEIIFKVTKHYILKPIMRHLSKRPPLSVANQTRKSKSKRRKIYQKRSRRKR